MYVCACVCVCVCLSLYQTEIIDLATSSPSEDDEGNRDVLDELVIQRSQQRQSQNADDQERRRTMQPGDVVSHWRCDRNKSINQSISQFTDAVVRARNSVTFSDSPLQRIISRGAVTSSQQPRAGAGAGAAGTMEEQGGECEAAMNQWL